MISDEFFNELGFELAAGEFNVPGSYRKVNIVFGNYHILGQTNELVSSGFG